MDGQELVWHSVSAWLLDVAAGSVVSSWRLQVVPVWYQGGVPGNRLRLHRQKLRGLRPSPVRSYICRWGAPASGVARNGRHYPVPPSVDT